MGACAAASALAGLPPAAVAAETAFDLTTPTGTLFGTLLQPVSAPPQPVLLIVAGSGPVDRDGNAGPIQLNMYRKLAAALAARGIASVRYDKRGIAASHAALVSEESLRFEDLANDVALWTAKLRADRRFSRVGIVGHSEGSLLGMLAAQKAPVDAFVSLEGAGFPIATVLREQLRPQLASVPTLAAAAEKIMTSLSDGKTVPAADVPSELMSLFRPSVQPYVISWFKYDPRVEIAKLAGPVTIVQGTHDVQVPVANGEALRDARSSATYVAIDGLTHMLVDDPGTTLAAQLAGAYSDASRAIDATLVAALVTAAGAA